jgi:hypothetical protein
MTIRTSRLIFGDQVFHHRRLTNSSMDLDRFIRPLIGFGKVLVRKKKKNLLLVMVA